MKITTIVAGTDLSEHANIALDHAVAVAARAGAEVVLVHVSDANASVFEEYIDKGDRNLLRQATERARERLASLCVEHARDGVTIGHRVVDGAPDTALLEVAAELGAELVVVGTHGRTGFRRFLLGSVAERVVRVAQRPVMVARGEPMPVAGCDHILVPTDFSETAERALELALEVVAPEGTVELLHCWQLPAAAGGYWGPAGLDDASLESMRTAIADGAATRGAELIERYRERHPNLSFTHLEAAPGRGIQQQLGNAPYELVVMGSHGRTGVRRVLLGSVAEATCRYAPCPVLVVHAPARKPAD